MLDFFEFIYNTISSVWEFFTSFLDNTLMLLSYLGVVTGICLNIIASMPAWLQTFGTITVMVLVLYMILGRNAGGKSGGGK